MVNDEPPPGHRYAVPATVPPPPRPFLRPMSAAKRLELFGQFRYEPTPTATDREAIRITDDWPRRNIVSVYVPQLHGLIGAPADCRVPWHRAGVDQFQDLWSAWERASLLSLVKSWAGSWCPRFVRGSTTRLSNHAWATAFDINVAWNPRGKHSPPAGAKGSLAELVPLAERHGFAWGEQFDTPDPMHLEIGE